MQFDPEEKVAQVALLASVVEHNVAELMGVGKPWSESEQWIAISIARDYERAHLLAQDFKVRRREQWDGERAEQVS